jgi:hypothetical protein
MGCSAIARRRLKCLLRIPDVHGSVIALKPSILVEGFRGYP